MRVRRAVARAAVALGGGLALVGCGASYPDLMLVERSGALPGARLELLISDGGDVRCNRGEPRPLPPRLLLDARDIARQLTDEAMADTAYPGAPNAQLRFHLRTEDGTVTFADVDGTRDPDLARLIALTRTIAQDVCHLPR